MRIIIKWVVCSTLILEGTYVPWSYIELKWTKSETFGCAAFKRRMKVPSVSNFMCHTKIGLRFVYPLKINYCLITPMKWNPSLVSKCAIGPFTLAKTKIQKPGFFVVPFTLPEKPITFGVFGTKSACAKKPESHTDVLVSGAHARLLSTFDCTRVVRITSRATGRVIPLKVTVPRDQKPE